MDQLKWHSKVNQLVVQEDYAKSVEDYEAAIQSYPNSLENYWCLGLAYFLEGQEDTAALVWFGAVSEHEIEATAILNLVQVLGWAADSLKQQERIQQAWAIRQYIREFSPQLLSNLLELCNLSFDLEYLTGETVAELSVINILQSTAEDPELSLITETLDKVLQVPDPESLEFAKACFSYFPNTEYWALRVTAAAETMAFKRKLGNFASALLKLCLEYDPENTTANVYLPRFLSEAQQYTTAITAAQKFYQYSTTLENRFLSSCVLLQTLMRSGDWRAVPEIANQFKAAILELLEDQSTKLPLHTIQFLIVNMGIFAYLQDNLAENRTLQNQVGQLFLKNIESFSLNTIHPTVISSKLPNKRLKIGYIGSTLRRHSVGWLSRWLFKYHNHEKFEICVYLVQQNPNDEFFQTWFLNHCDQVKILSEDAGIAAERIRSDQLDILVDLDSLTLGFTCTILALKPAPIQVTWLGCDSSGLPTIDYFIADPYVLPENAQDHYQEKIWRLPHTYIAVDDFEVGVPTLSRSDLNIPEDAVVYWSSQVGFKRYPNIIRLQMKILKKVSESYFIIKGLGDQDMICDLFSQIADEEGVKSDRLIFMSMMSDEYTHRANLQLADIALDTYPYNGATTSLEILWAGVPLITRVGSTFSSRNSYTFMQNLGIEEGISWTDEEYMEWGVRLGSDKKLRQQVSWKLRQSRRTSPLWNAKQFTKEMESAYEQMWTQYVNALQG